MGNSELSVLVVDDDFRVAQLHAGIVNAIPGFTVTATANTLTHARQAAAAGAIDLALVDVYLPDGSGLDLTRELRCDTMVLTAATEADTIRCAVSAGALSYLVKPFTHADLAARLAGYARYRRILAKPNLGAHDVDAALEALRPRAVTPQAAVVASPTKRLVLQALRSSPTPMSSGEVATAVGISRATAQRYLATLATTGEVAMRLRYGTTGRPEQEFAIASDGSRKESTTE
ncbi:MAG: response regulator of citrate/malate metabolism [Mycobacterium sp.]|jgi:response regulator of citrate/malate metabolism|nr:response regulator of citrate/malate metabolism [Mycobacterium sp.]